MFKIALPKKFLVYFVVNTLAMCPILGHASEDGGGAAGNAGVICKGKLADQVRAKLAQPFNPMEEPLSGSDLLHILNVADSVSPAFGQALRIGLKKNWRFDIPANGFKDCHPENPYAASNPTYMKVSCQTASEVTVNPLFWESPDMDSCKIPNTDEDSRTMTQNQIALDVHHALLGITLGTQLTDDDTNGIFRELTKPQIDPASLKRALASSGLMPYIEQALQKLPGTQPTVASGAAMAKETCNKSPDSVTPGTLNTIDGSCTFDHPKVFINGKWMPVHMSGSSSLIGFCATQKMVPVNNDISAGTNVYGCDSQDSCDSVAIELNAAGAVNGFNYFPGHVDGDLDSVMCK